MITWNSLFGTSKTMDKRFIFTVTRKSDMGPQTMGMEPEPLPRRSRTDGGLPRLALCPWRSFGGRLQVCSYPSSQRLGVLLRFLRDSQVEPSRQLLLVVQGKAHKSKLVLDGVGRGCRVANYEEDSRDVPGGAQGQEHGGPDAAGQSPWPENRELHDRRLRCADLGVSAHLIGNVFWEVSEAVGEYHRGQRQRAPQGFERVHQDRHVALSRQIDHRAHPHDRRMAKAESNATCTRHLSV